MALAVGDAAVRPLDAPHPRPAIIRHHPRQRLGRAAIVQGVCQTFLSVVKAGRDMPARANIPALRGGSKLAGWPRRGLLRAYRCPVARFVIGGARQSPISRPCIPEHTLAGSTPAARSSSARSRSGHGERHSRCEFARCGHEHDAKQRERRTVGPGLEGIVSKRTDAPYRGGPSKMWLKSKNLGSEAVRREREEEWRKPWRRCSCHRPRAS